MLRAGRGSGGRLRALLSRGWLVQPCASAGADACDFAVGNVGGDKGATKLGFRVSSHRTGMSWAAQTSKRRQDEAGFVEISPDDFIFQQKFKEGPFLSYKEGRLRGLYRKDPRQELVILKMQELYNKLRKALRRHQGRSGLTLVDSLGENPTPPAWWKGIVKLMEGQSSSNPAAGDSPVHPGKKGGCSTLEGLYLYGGPGTGKTMLMDLFVACSPPEFRVHRIHFHDFMSDVHARIHQYPGVADPLCEVANDIAKGCRVLALDELFVEGVADASVVGRLFNKLWSHNVTLICTSNRLPDNLYEGGLQRELFLPFIEMLKEACVVHNMDSPVDYRKLVSHRNGLYFTNPNEAVQSLGATFGNMAGSNMSLTNIPMEVRMGRTIHVPKSAGNVAYYTFKQLCGQPLGAADYISLATNYHSICLEGIPKITAATRSEAYRLVILIDVLYDHRIRLACTAETPATDLFENIITQSDLPPEGIKDSDSEIVVDDNLGFAKDRTISRLLEMQSIEYQVDHANRHAPELLLALAEAQAKEGRDSSGSMATTDAVG